MGNRILYAGAILNQNWPGGEPIVARGLIDFLRINGHQVYEAYWRSSLSSIVDIKGALRMFTGRADINKGALKFYMREIERIKPDVIISQYDYDTSIIEAAKLTSKRVIVYVHIYWPICPKLSLRRNNIVDCDGFIGKDCYQCTLSDRYVLNSLTRKLAFRLITNTNHLAGKMSERLTKLRDKNVTIVTLNSAMKDLLVHNSIDGDTVFTIGNGLDLSEFTVLRSNREKKICYVGGSSDKKGYRVFLSICEELKARIPDIQITATGDYTTKVIRDFPYIDFVGRVERSILLKILQEARCLVFPAVWRDPSPLPPIEAAAVGTPVVGSGIENLSNVIENGFSGYVLPRGDVIGFVDRIELLLNDDLVFERMSRNARLNIEKFANKDYTHREFLELVEKVIHWK